MSLCGEAKQKGVDFSQYIIYNHSASIKFLIRILGNAGIYLSLIGDNDRALFEKIYLANRKQMFYPARSIVKSDEDAEDIAHDVFARLHHFDNCAFSSCEALENITIPKSLSRISRKFIQQYRFD